MINHRYDKISETQYKFFFIFFILLAIFKNLSHFKVKSSQTLIWRCLSTWQTCDKLVTNDKKMGQMAFCLMVWPNNFINLSQILSHGTKMWQTGDKIWKNVTNFWPIAETLGITGFLRCPKSDKICPMWQKMWQKWDKTPKYTFYA